MQALAFVLGTAVLFAADRTPSPAELLERIRAAQRETAPVSFSSKYVLEAQYKDQPEAREWMEIVGRQFQDESRIDRRSTTRRPAEVEGTWLVQYNQSLWDGDRHFEVGRYAGSGPSGSDRWGGGMSRDDNYAQFSNVFGGAELRGTAVGDSQPYFEFFDDSARDVTVSVDETTFDGVAVYVLEGDTARGHYKVWVDPEKDYIVRRLEARKGANDLGWDGGPISEYEWLPLKDSHYVFEASAIEEVDGRFVVTAGRATTESAYLKEGPGGSPSSTTVFDIAIENVDFNPDFDALRAFEPDMPDGTVLSDWDLDTRVVWRDGKFVPYVDSKTLGDILTDLEVEDNEDVQTFLLPGGVPLEMIATPPGRFRMGSTEGDADEAPVHDVTI